MLRYTPKEWQAAEIMRPFRPERPKGPEVLTKDLVYFFVGPEGGK